MLRMNKGSIKEGPKGSLARVTKQPNFLRFLRRTIGRILMSPMSRLCLSCLCAFSCCPRTRDETALIIPFFQGKEVEIGANGKTERVSFEKFEYMLKHNWPLVETKHNWIQLMIPNWAPSKARPGSPHLTKEIVRKFEEDSEEGRAMRGRLVEGLIAWMSFLGMKVDERTHQVTQAVNCDERVLFLVRHTHNYLRITRTLRCFSAFTFFKKERGEYHWIAKGFCNVLESQAAVVDRSLYQGKISETEASGYYRAQTLWRNAAQESGCASSNMSMQSVILHNLATIDTLWESVQESYAFTGVTNRSDFKSKENIVDFLFPLSLKMCPSIS